MKRNNLKGSLILCFASLIWGLAFVAQSDAADYVPPFMFNCIRSVIAAIFLYIVILVKNTKRKEPLIPKDTHTKKAVLWGSALCGIMLTVSANFQQFGLWLYPDGAPSEARGGFITALYVIIVPLLSLFMGKKISSAVLIAAAVAMGGIYLLCLSEGIAEIYMGDVLMLCCAFCFAVHILVVDRFGQAAGGIRLSMLQFIICAVLSGILALIFEADRISLKNIFAAAPQMLYMGIMSSGIAYTLQIVGQKYAEAAVASLSMSLESVFAALGGWIISSNALSLKELIGCGLVFAAIILAQLPDLKKRNT